MNGKRKKTGSRYMRCQLRPLFISILFALSGSYFANASEGSDSQDIQFNTDVLDVKDRQHIDLSHFARAGYVMPGKYHMKLRVNHHELNEVDVVFRAPVDDPKGSEPCITADIAEQIGLKDKMKSQLVWQKDGTCIDLSSLPGSKATGNLADNILDVSIPQAYIEYIADNWDPPSRWDEGIPGVILDYNINARNNTRADDNKNEQNVSGNGVVGMNAGPWRLRGDWQGNYYHVTGVPQPSQHSLRMSRYYMYRAIGALRAKLTLGENYLYSDIFDSFRFIGASLISDDSMLPPNLRGYAPEVSGVAKTDAKVTVMQQGRVLYETQVPAGPFRIQDLSSAVSGALDVQIREQDGSVRTFQVNTANIPYLTRPGLVRYKMAVGQPSDYLRQTRGPGFANGEFSWGVNNGWSLYGGAILGGNYNAFSGGIGRDLLAFGALSFDATQSRARLPKQGNKTGESYKLSYSKRFEEINSQVTFAGYRFSERNYLSMSQYLELRYRGANYGQGKELYTITVNKQFESLGLSSYLNYSHQTYWDRPANDNYTFSLAKYFDFMRLKNLSFNLTAFRSVYNNTHDDGAYMTISVPWGNSGSVNYDGQYYKSGSSHSVSLNDRIDSNSNYQVSAGMDSGGHSNVSGFYTRDGDLTSMTANASYNSSQYSAIGMSLQGGMTATAKGVALHRVSTVGATRMMLDTDGVADVPLVGNGGVSRSNIFGKAVIGDLNNYYRSSVRVDLDKLSDNVDAPRSVVQSSLTEGAIGYRKLGVVAGEKAMAVIKLVDGSSPPFGAVVENSRGYQTGIISDDGSVWLTGINAGEKMNVKWNEKINCSITLPTPLPPLTSGLLLPCEKVSGK
ncbi:outer membrane usher protein [Pantoea sp. C2G6]|uniref:outer membrane usher protein n=1 Tax=Pantoea sp. C2G6 TaxID=3243084 RepID=UPI003EDB5BB7